MGLTTGSCITDCKTKIRQSAVFVLPSTSGAAQRYLGCRPVAALTASHARGPRNETLAPISNTARILLGISFFVLFVGGMGLCDLRRLCLEDLSRRSADHGARTAGCC